MKLLIYLLFTLSGFIGLIYESIWSRYLKLFFGHSFYGQVLTLIIFMGGLGLGSFIGGKYIKKFKNPFYVYGAIELIIGLGAISYHNFYIFSTNIFYKNITSLELPNIFLVFIKIIITLINTFPLAILLGMTFPCIAIAMLRLTKDNGRTSLSVLYFTNSIGAGIGILFSSYFFIPRFGLIGALTLSGSLNILIALCFYFISRNYSYEDSLSDKKNIDNIEEIKINNISESFKYYLLLISFMTGFSSFIYEIGWIRLLSLVMGASTHSFDLMVSSFIIGLAFGGIFSKQILKKSENIILSLAFIQIAMGIMATISIYFYEFFFEFIRQSNFIFMRTEIAYNIYSFFKYLLCLLMITPTSFFAGMTLPILTFIAINFNKDEKYTGFIYGWNTFGAILGSFLGGIVVLPLLQIKFTIISGALIDILIGFIILQFFTDNKNLKKILISVSLIILIPSLFFRYEDNILSSGYFRNTVKLNDDVKTILKDGKTASISFHEDTYQMMLKTNGKTDSSFSKDSSRLIGDEVTQAALALLSAKSLNEPYNASIIGLGGGFTSHYLLADNLLKELDIIEIEKEVFNLAKGFLPYNRRTYEDPRVKFYFEDAKTFFYNHNKKYDIIISEPSNPWVSGVSSLFTDEFYKSVNKFLNQYSVFVQWLHIYEFDPDILLSIFKALDMNFVNFHVYRYNMDIVVIASNQKLHSNISRFAGNNLINYDLSYIKENLLSFDSKNLILTNKSLKPLLSNINPNSDYFPIVDSNAEKYFFMKKNAEGLFLPYETGPFYYQELIDQDFISLKSRYFTSKPIDKIKYFSISNKINNLDLNNQDEWIKELSNLVDLFGINLRTDIWQESELIRNLRVKTISNKIPPKASVIFSLLDSVNKKNSDKITSSLEIIEKSFSPSELSIPLIKISIIYSVFLEKHDLYNKLIQKFVISNPYINKYDKSIMLNLYSTAKLK